MFQSVLEYDAYILVSLLASLVANRSRLYKSQATFTILHVVLELRCCQTLVAC